MDTNLDNAAVQVPLAGNIVASRWQFGVLGGMHAGAVVDLDPQAWLVIGSAADCDLVLRDDGVQPHHLMLYWQQGQLVVRALHFGVAVGDLPLEPGTTQVIQETVSCQIDEIAVGIGSTDSPHWQALLQAAAEPEPTAVPGETPTVTAEAGETQAGAGLVPEPDQDDAAVAFASAATPSRTNAVRKLVALASASGMAVILGMAFWVSVSHHALARQAPSAIASTLASLGLGEVKLVDGDNGHIRVEGTVPTESQRTELISVLSAKGLSPSLHVVSGQQLAMTVQDTFRQRGMVVEARYLGAGQIKVDGATATAETQKIIAEILKGTASIQRIEVGSTLPPGPALAASVPPVPPASAKAAFANTARDPKRVIGVIDGEMAYVLTSDGTHYMIGSLMPDGSQVETIEGHAITLLREGQRVVVQF